MYRISKASGKFYAVELEPLERAEVQEEIHELVENGMPVILVDELEDFWGPVELISKY